MAKSNQKPHAIVIPCPFQGHINPSIHLSLKLATKGFAITFINTESTHAQITKSQLDQNSTTTTHDIFAKFQEFGLDIHYQTVSDGFPLEFDRSSGSNTEEFWEGFLLNYPIHVDEIVGKLVELENPRPTCLIVDTFFAWGTTIANKYELVSVSFFTQPALVFTIDYHHDLLLKNGHFGSNVDNSKDTIDYLPGISAIEPSDLPSYFQTKETSTILHQIIYKGFEDAKKSDIIICNTIQELESKVISTLQEKTKKPFYAIGPIFHDQVNSLKNVKISKSLWPESNCLEWLNTRPKSSVLYFSLGSLFSLSKEDVMELAQGLMLSKVDFIWVLRPNLAIIDETDNYLPDGFQENVDRGLVVPWCDQRGVLSHPAIGGFLTHCGWNSILESLWACVPMMCHPIGVDQQTNRKLVVDEWRVGINLCDNYNNKSIITKEKVAKKINFLMSEENSKGLRKVVKEVKKIMEIALLANGSSEKNFDLFVEDVMAKTKIGLL